MPVFFRLEVAMIRVCLLLIGISSLAHADTTVEDEPDSKPVPVEHRMTCGDLTAIWRGHREYGHASYQHMSFQWGTGKTHGSTVAVSENVEVDGTAIFSPDCKHVLLPKSRYGPYHIVRSDRLRAYLRGAKPDHVLDGVKDPRGITGTGTFDGGSWISDDEVAYSWGCCDPHIISRYRLSTRTSTEKMGESRARGR